MARINLAIAGFPVVQIFDFMLASCVSEVRTALALIVIHPASFHTGCCLTGHQNGGVARINLAIASFPVVQIFDFMLAGSVGEVRTALALVVIHPASFITGGGLAGYLFGSVYMHRSFLNQLEQTDVIVTVGCLKLVVVPAQSSGAICNLICSVVAICSGPPCTGIAAAKAGAATAQVTAALQLDGVTTTGRSEDPIVIVGFHGDGVVPVDGNIHGVVVACGCTQCLASVLSNDQILGAAVDAVGIQLIGKAGYGDNGDFDGLGGNLLAAFGAVNNRVVIAGLGSSCLNATFFHSFAGGMYMLRCILNQLEQTDVFAGAGCIKRSVVPAQISVVG